MHEAGSSTPGVEYDLSQGAGNEVQVGQCHQLVVQSHLHQAPLPAEPSTLPSEASCIRNLVEYCWNSMIQEMRYIGAGLVARRQQMFVILPNSSDHHQVTQA